MKSQLRASIKPGLQILKTLWRPFVAIQLFGLAIVLCYFYYTPVTRALDWLADRKQDIGLAFAAISMPIACGLLPEVFKSLTRVERGWPRSRITFMIHNAVLFCVMGVIVEFFYIWMNGWIGATASAGTVLAKVCVDQFGYSTFFAVPAIALSFNWRRRQYKVAPTLRDLDRAWYLREAVPVLLVNWAYWIPMGALMYTLPTKLTFIYGVIGNAASATLLCAIAGRQQEPVSASTSLPDGREGLTSTPASVPPATVSHASVPPGSVAVDAERGVPT